MDRLKVTIKGIDPDAWDMVQQIRTSEQRFIGAIITECIWLYYETHILDDEEEAVDQL